MWNWIRDPQLVQAVSSCVLAILTLALILLTAVYARANWRTMRIAEADVAHRTRPFPSTSVAFFEISASEIEYNMRITVRNAPMLLSSAVIVWNLGDGTEYIDSLPLPGDRPVAADDQFTFGSKLRLKGAPSIVSTTLSYSDAARIKFYVSTFWGDALVTRVVNPPSKIRSAWRKLNARLDDLDRI